MRTTLVLSLLLSVIMVMACKNSANNDQDTLTQEKIEEINKIDSLSNEYSSNTNDIEEGINALEEALKEMESSNN